MIVSHDPYLNLSGALYDIEAANGHCDAVSLRTLKRVGAQLATIKRREKRLHAALCEIANRAGREEGCGANWARNWALVTVETDEDTAP